MDWTWKIFQLNENLFCCIIARLYGFVLCLQLASYVLLSCFSCVSQLLQWICGKKGRVFQRHYCVTKPESSEIWQQCVEGWTRVGTTWYELL